MKKNNGVANIENDERKVQPSNLMVMSPLWSSKSSRASKSFAPQSSPNSKVKKNQPYRPDSDSTSMSADSPLSHNSMLTQHSSVSQVKLLNYGLFFCSYLVFIKIFFIYSVQNQK